MEWKGPREWAIERDSIRNKRNYAEMWGYSLEVADMATKKRYAHEWRESWEKVDTIRSAMRKYPDAEWYVFCSKPNCPVLSLTDCLSFRFWWMDLHTYVMEPTYSLQSHIFNQLQETTYRDINKYNPLNISHPPTEEWLDEVDRSAIGDGRPSSINMIIPQDCSGFNLGSFFIRRSAWTDRLLDIWWDPVGYEQKHMEWEHKEQDALEHIYTHQPWVRSHIAFIPQRKINSFPQGACSENGESSLFHYSQADRDFFVNMAGCQWGRDCWNELYEFRRISQMLNRNVFVKVKDWTVNLFSGSRNKKNKGKSKSKPKSS